MSIIVNLIEMKPMSYKEFLKQDAERLRRKLDNEKDSLKRLRIISEINRIRVRLNSSLRLTKCGDA